MKKLVFFIMCAAAFFGGAHAQSVTLDTLYGRDSVYFLLRLTGYNNPWVAVLSIEQPFCTTCLFAYPYNEEFYILLADDDNSGVFNYYTPGIQNPLVRFNLTLHSDSRGIAVGTGSFTAGTEVEIVGIPVVGNHFVQWSDGSTENPRHILVTSDTSLTASFAADEIGITDVVSSGATITVQGNNITVQGAEGKRVRIFDSVGRLLSTEQSVSETQHFRVMSAGVYLVQIGDASARKVVVR